MRRSPLFYPLSRGMDADAGGAADLQTDVMRFMAILSLCLVAIFALVQSIPLAPSTENPAPDVDVAELKIAATPVGQPTSPETGPAAMQDVHLTRPEPRQRPQEDSSPVLQRSFAETAAVAAEPEAVATTAEPAVAKPPTPEPPQEGFSLRFEDDAALTRLVARNEVGLYAIFPDKSLRLNVDNGQLGFWPASMPDRYHEMEPSTVPKSVIEAFRRSNGRHPAGLQWGVTIPPVTARQLDRYLHQSKSGTLIIDAQGDLRLEH